MGGKKYSAFVTLAVEAEDGRINNTAFTLKLDGIDTPLSTSQAQGVYTFPETEIVGYGVSGNVESFNSGTDPVTIQLIEQGQSEPAYETIVSGGTQIGNKFTAPYTFYDIPSGTYTMKVMKQNHVTREYTVIVGTNPVVQDVKIHLLGDIDGNVQTERSLLWMRRVSMRMQEVRQNFGNMDIKVQNVLIPMSPPYTPYGDGGKGLRI